MDDLIYERSPITTAQDVRNLVTYFNARAWGMESARCELRIHLDLATIGKFQDLVIAGTVAQLSCSAEPFIIMPGPCVIPEAHGVRCTVARSGNYWCAERELAVEALIERFHNLWARRERQMGRKPMRATRRGPGLFSCMRAPVKTLELYDRTDEF